LLGWIGDGEGSVLIGRERNGEFQYQTDEQLRMFFASVHGVIDFGNDEGSRGCVFAWKLGKSGGRCGIGNVSCVEGRLGENGREEN
jgi:hypothetical protein